MEGKIDNQDEWGVIPRSAEDIFQRLSHKNYVEWSVYASYLEIYNEDLTDLLIDDSVNAPPSLKIVEDRGDEKRRGKGVMVFGLSEEEVRSTEDVLQLMERAQQRRKTGETKMNKSSSRSHCLFTLCVHAKLRVEDGGLLDTTGKLHMVDLAGSECAKSAGMGEKETAGRERERKNINQSLLTLGRVISLLKSNQTHPGKVQERIPYRDSKLTRLLSESLGGRSKTVIVATVSPSVLAVEETTSTLQYAQSAQGIQNKPVAQSYLKMNADGRPGTAGGSSGGGAGINIEQWQEMEARLAYLEAQADEATAALARKHKEQEVIVARAKKAEAEAEELREKMEIVTEAVTKATTCAAEAETALETIKASATQLTNELHERRNDLRNLLEDKVSKQSAKFAELAGSSVTAMHKAATDGAAATAEALNGAGEAQGKLLDGHQIMLTESVQSLEEASKSSVTRISAALKETTEMMHASEEKLQSWCDALCAELGAKSTQWSDTISSLNEEASSFAEKTGSGLREKVHDALERDGKALVERILVTEVASQKDAIDEATRETIARRDASVRFYTASMAGIDELSNRVGERVKEHNRARRDVASIELCQSTGAAIKAEVGDASAAFEAIQGSVAAEVLSVEQIGAQLTSLDKALHTTLDLENRTYEQLQRDLGTNADAVAESLRVREERGQFEKMRGELSDDREQDDASTAQLVELLQSHLSHLRELRVTYFAKQQTDHERSVSLLEEHIRNLHDQHENEVAAYQKHNVSLTKQLADLRAAKTFIASAGRDALVQRILSSVTETVNREVDSYVGEVVGEHMDKLESTTERDFLPWCEKAQSTSVSDHQNNFELCDGRMMKQAFAEMHTDMRSSLQYVRETCEDEDITQKALPHIAAGAERAKERSDAIGRTMNAWHNADVEVAAAVHQNVDELRSIASEAMRFHREDIAAGAYEATFLPATSKLSDSTARVRTQLAGEVASKVTTCAVSRANATTKLGDANGDMHALLKGWQSASTTLETAMQDDAVPSLQKLNALVSDVAAETGSHDEEIARGLAEEIATKNESIASGLSGEVAPLMSRAATAAIVGADAVSNYAKGMVAATTALRVDMTSEMASAATSMRDSVESRAQMVREEIPARCVLIRDTADDAATKQAEVLGGVANGYADSAAVIRQALAEASGDFANRAAHDSAAAETTVALATEGAATLVESARLATEGAAKLTAADEATVSRHRAEGIDAPVDGIIAPRLGVVAEELGRIIGTTDDGYAEEDFESADENEVPSERSK